MNTIDKIIVIGFFAVLLMGAVYGQYTAPREKHGSKYIIANGKYYVRSDVDVNKLQQRLSKLEKKQQEIKSNKDTPETRCRTLSYDQLLQYCIEAEDMETAPPIDYSAEIQRTNEEINKIREASTITTNSTINTNTSIKPKDKKPIEPIK